MATNEVTAQIFYYIRVSSSLITNCSSTVQYTNLERLLRVENGSRPSLLHFDLALVQENLPAHAEATCNEAMSRGASGKDAEIRLWKAFSQSMAGCVHASTLLRPSL